MKKWLLTLALFAIPFYAIAQQSVVVPATMSSINVLGTVSAISKIISGATGKRIYITAVSLYPANTSVVTLSQGTGTNCGTGTAAIFGPVTFPSTMSWVQGTGYGTLYALDSGTDLCLTIATAVSPGFISYAQF